jgi:hypothetical protein
VEVFMKLSFFKKYIVAAALTLLAQPTVTGALAADKGI